MGVMACRTVNEDGRAGPHQLQGGDPRSTCFGLGGGVESGGFGQVQAVMCQSLAVTLNGWVRAVKACTLMCHWANPTVWEGGSRILGRRR